MLRNGLLLLFAGIVIAMAEQGFVSAAEQVASIEGITEYRLENGVRILLFPDPSKPKVTVNMTVFVGSRHEGYGEAGMAHLLEHMLFKGTPDHQKIPKLLQDRGADFNGTTSLDRTNYYETLPASDDNLKFAIGLEADRLVNSYVKGEDLKSEMTVVRNEFESGENSPLRILDQRVTATAYEWHNYGQSTIGNRADIERVPIENLQRFYRKYYQPDNIMVIVAGAFDEQTALSEIESTFGAIPRPDRVLDETYTEEPAQDGERLVTLRRVGDVGLASAVYHICSGPHPDYVSLDVLDHILRSSPSGRLYKGLVESKLAARVSGYAEALHDPGLLKIYAEATPGVDPRDVLSKMLEIAESVGVDGVTEEEVERAKRYWMKNWEMSFTDTSQIARYLSEWASQGDWRLMFLYRDRLEQVTADSVTAAAAKYIVQNNRTAGLFIPTEEPDRTTIPATPSLAEMIGNYQGREAVAEGEAFDLSPENIESRSIRVTLPSGVKAVFLPKKTRGGSVVGQVNLRYGNPEALRGLAVATELLPTLMTRGTQSLDRQEIQDVLDQNNAKLSASGSVPGLFSLDFETRRNNLPVVLDLIRQILREPTLPESELEIIRNATVSANVKALTDPFTLARVALRRALDKTYDSKDPRYNPTLEEDIARIKATPVDELKQLYEEFFNGNNGEIVILGDFEVSDVQPLLESMLADWSSDIPFERVGRPDIVELTAGREEILVPGKENATYLAGTLFPITDAHEDYPALVMANYVLGSSGLASRLGDRVRQEEGLSYGIGSFMQGSPIDPRTSLMVYAITNPDNMSKVETAIREEFERLLADGITEEELTQSQQGYLENQTVERSDDERLAGVLANTAYINRTMDFYTDQESKIANLTVADVNAALRKHLDLSRYVMIEAGDLHRKPQTGSSAEGKKPMPEKNGEFQTTESGLKYKILVAGNGGQPTATSTVVCHYKGWLDDGTQFDSSYDRGEPATFPLNRVIRGWTEGLQLIKSGGKIELEIPADLGYGDRGAPPVIPGGATLHFEVELLEIK